mgnify:CR=1 FL=1
MAKKTKKEFEADEAKAVYSYNDKGMLRNGKFVMNKPFAGTMSRKSYDKDVAEWKKKESLKKYKKATEIVHHLSLRRKKDIK